MPKATKASRRPKAIPKVELDQHAWQKVERLVRSAAKMDHQPTQTGAIKRKKLGPKRTSS